MAQRAITLTAFLLFLPRTTWAEPGHAIDASAGAGLFEPVPDEVFASPFHLSAADASAGGQPLRSRS